MTHHLVDGNNSGGQIGCTSLSDLGLNRDPNLTSTQGDRFLSPAACVVYVGEEE